MKNKNELMKRHAFGSLAAGLALIFFLSLATPRPAKADLIEYGILIGILIILTSTVVDVVPDSGKKTATLNNLNMAMDSVQTARGANDTGDIDMEVSAISSAHGNLTASQALLKAFPALQEQASQGVGYADFIKADAIKRLTAGPDSCGNGVCDAGENFCTCASDCEPDVIGCP